MEAKNIKYDIIEQEINANANEIINNIIMKFGQLLREEDIIRIKKDKNIIKVDKPSNEDNMLFGGQIPTAHGPRTKNDGYIHIYPYVIAKNCADEHDIVEKITKFVLVHEIAHFFIKLDDELLKGEENEYSHYITEGAVQLFTEDYRGEADLKTNYRKNVEAARVLSEVLGERYLELIFSKSIKDIKDMPEYEEKIKYLIDQFKREKQFVKGIDPLLSEIEKRYNLKEGYLSNTYKRYSLEEQIKYFKDQVYTMVESTNKQDEYIEKVDQLYESIYGDEKRDYTV